MAQLLGPDGRPVDRSALKEEQAGPTLTGVRQLLGGHPAQGLTPARLASLLREAEEGDPTRYLELAEEMEEKDLHYLSVVGTRKRAVAQLDITVEPASDAAEHQRHAELIQAFLDREELEDELIDILDAVGKGYSATEIIWDTSASQWMPRRLEWRFPQWFLFDRADGRTLHLRTEGGTEPLAPFKFITHFHKAKSGVPIRGGLARAAAWGYLFKNYGVKDWVVFAEVYGQPLRIGKYHAGASPEDKETLLRAVANIGSDAAAIVPSSMLIEFVETASKPGSIDLYERLADWLDRQVSKAVLGQTLTTEVGGTGSFAAAKVHDDVREDIERSDCKQLAATLNRDLARPMIDLNFGPQDLYPRIRIGRPETTNVPELSEALAKLVPLGLRVRQSEVRAKLGIEDPEGDDELLGPAGPATVTDAPPGATVTAAAREESARDADSIDDLVREELEGEGWLDAMAPIMEALRGLLREVDDFDELLRRLPEAIPDPDLLALGEQLARDLFAARLAGASDVTVTDE